MDRLSPLSYGEDAKLDRPVVHRGIRPVPSTSVIANDRRSVSGQGPNTITNGMESYLKNLDERKKGLKTEWKKASYQSSGSSNCLPQLDADTLDTKFHHFSTSKPQRNKAASPTNHQTQNISENGTSLRRFHTPLLDMPTPTRGEVAELESAIDASPYDRIREWQTEAQSENTEIPNKWELRHWHLLEYWYEFHDNDVEAATRSFYEHESSTKSSNNSETRITTPHKWPMEDIKRRCQCLDTNIRYNGISPRKRKRRSSVSSTNSQSSTTSRLVTVASLAISKLTNTLMPKRQRLLSRETSNISIDEKSSTSSMNSSFNRLWNDNKSYFNRQQQLPKRPSYARQQLQPDWQEATLNKPILSTKSNKNVNYRQKRQLGLKDITPERELTPPSYDSKYYELPEPRSFMEKEFLEPAEDFKRYPYSSNPQNTTAWISSTVQFNRCEGSKLLHNVDGKIKEEDKEPSLDDISTDAASRVKVHWYENPTATPRRGHVRELLKHLEKGIPMDSSEFDRNIPVYSTLDKSTSP